MTGPKGETTKEGFAADDISSAEWMDAKLTSGARVILGASALMILAIDPSDTHRWIVPLYLILYTLYALLLYYLSRRQHPFVIKPILPWLDLLWYVPLIAFTSGTNSIFYYFFFFSIIVAAFRWGLNSGLRLALASATLFTIVGFLTALPGPPIEMNRLLLAPIGLLIFGYIISRWGGYYLNLKRRLQVLKDVTIFSNPRFGIDRTIKSILESVRDYYDADACLLVIPGLAGRRDSYQMHRVARGNRFTKTSLPEIGRDAAALFLSPDQEHAVFYNRESDTPIRVFDLKARQLPDGNSANAEKLSVVLEATSYLSVPVNYRNQPLGRLCIVNGPQVFEESDVEFVFQLTDHVTPVIENIRLIDNLASEAAEQERQRIAHDIHDSVIQPYLGLRFGLTAINQNLEAGNTAVLSDVHELLELTNHELAELRRYVWDLRTGEERADVLLPAIERYTTRFSSVTGIRVVVHARGRVDINDRLAGELFQVVTEGLSNIRRHAFCRDAQVEISSEDDSIVIEIKNSRPETGTPSENGNSDGKAPFTPRSIAERVSLLGGQTKVFIDEQDYTVVRVTVPI